MRALAVTCPAEAFFEITRILDAVEWARAGGIAIHRNWDVTGMKIGSKVRSGQAYHVFGRRDLLLAWGKRNGQRASWLQDEHERGTFADLPHFDVFGAPARAMERRLNIPPLEVTT